MKNFRPDKKIKRKKNYKDFKKKNNILVGWSREQDNRKYDGKKLRGMPVEFPMSKKELKN